MYYATWCGHSRNFLPVWNSVKNTIKNDSALNTICLDYDCDINRNLCVGVRGYPHVEFIKNDGTKIDYNGQRSVQSIIDFINKNK